MPQQFKISPKYKIHLAEQITEKIWDEFVSYPKSLAYIQEWHISDDYGNWENFSICYKDKNCTQIDVFPTVSGMPDDIILKVAIDLGIETPDFIPSIPTFRNEIKEHYKNASEVFEKAYRDVETDPSLAIGLANSALESIVKDVLINIDYDGYDEHDTLQELVKKLCKKFKEDNKHFPPEILNISNNFLNAARAIEDLRSAKTSFHGKSSSCETIQDPIYAYFILNAVSTVGLFILNYFGKNKPVPSQTQWEDDLPF